MTESQAQGLIDLLYVALLIFALASWFVIYTLHRIAEALERRTPKRGAHDD